MTYTYDDFVKAAKSDGLYEQFSPYDLSTAKNNPSAGMAILNAKKGYRAATTDSERARFNAEAEAVRRNADSYLGGSDGMGYLPLAKETASAYGGGALTAPAAKETASAYPSYQEKAAPPSYTSPYAAKIQAALGQMESVQPFTYDKENDPSFQAYRKQYLREGDRAFDDTLAKASAASGGVASSYAISAAQQAKNYYNAQLADKLPELQQAAYARYLADIEKKRSDLATLMSAEEAEYSKYLNELDRYNADREFDYSKYLNEISLKRTAEQDRLAADQLAYEREQTDYAKRLQEAQLAAAYGNTAPLSELLGVNVSVPAVEDAASDPYTDFDRDWKIGTYLLEETGDAAYLNERFGLNILSEKDAILAYHNTMMDRLEMGDWEQDVRAYFEGMYPGATLEEIAAELGIEPPEEMPEEDTVSPTKPTTIWPGSGEPLLNPDRSINIYAIR